jgi:hypothetical protein
MRELHIARSTAVRRFYGDEGLALLTEAHRLESVHEPAEGVKRLTYDNGLTVIANESDQAYNGVAPGNFNRIN